MISCIVFFFKQKTAYEMRISDWSSDVCSSDLPARLAHRIGNGGNVLNDAGFIVDVLDGDESRSTSAKPTSKSLQTGKTGTVDADTRPVGGRPQPRDIRSEEGREGTGGARPCRSKRQRRHN